MIPRIGGIAAMILTVSGSQALMFTGLVVAAVSAGFGVNLHRRVRKLEDRDND